MKYYKDIDGSVVVLGDDKSGYDGLIEITQQEALEASGFSANSDETKARRYAYLEDIIVKMIMGLKRIAIGKEWMTNYEAINIQYDSYNELYKQAKNGYFDDDTNQAIIAKHEYIDAIISKINKLINDGRAKLEELIEENNEDVDSFLDMANNVAIDPTQDIDEQVANIRSEFGI